MQVKKVHFIILLLLTFQCIYINAQQRELLYIVDSMQLLCHYKQKVIVHNPEERINIEEVFPTVLQIGYKMSKYSDYNDYMVDSIKWTESKNKDGYDPYTIADKIMQYRINNNMKEKLYKNYPINKISTKVYLLTSYTYDEPYEKPNWTLLNESKIILGYPCKKATTTFRGRKYEAWYTTKIPISNGPWKFHGLPGLILRARDNKGEVSFEIESIISPKNVKYIYKDNDGPTCIHLKNKKEFTKLKKDYMDNPGAHVAASGLIQSELPPMASKKRPYNPIELSE